MGLTPFARRRSLKLRLNYIEEKIIAVQEELHSVEQTVSETSPGLFVNEHLGVKALKHQLEHLEKVAASIRKELSSRGSK
jgi:prefoldin subunit 5